MNDLHGCTHGWEGPDGDPIECPDCKIVRLARERDEFRLLNEDKFRHLNAYRIAATEDKGKIADLTRERDEAREAAKWLLHRTETFTGENEAIKRWPWLEYSI